MPSPTPTPSTPKMGTTKYSVSRGGMQGKPLALPGEKLYNIVRAVRPGAVVQVLCPPVQAFGAPTPQKLPHFLFFTLIIADAPKIASTKTPCQGPFSDSDTFFLSAAVPAHGQTGRFCRRKKNVCPAWFPRRAPIKGFLCIRAGRMPPPED